MTLAQWIEQAALIVANHDAVKNDFPVVESVEDFRFDADRDFYLAIGAELYPLVQQAVAAERERCAVIAETWVIDWARPSGHMPDDIAAAIRQMKDVNDG